jgi:GTP pyrophosphokinase
VIGPHGQPFEVQIRTEEMHRVAEEGIAAHWKYKDGKPAQREDEQRMAWLRRLVDLQQEMRDASDYLSTLKIDLYPQEVYTFTPKGKVVVLPREATPIDFAYSIHTEVGHHCVSAKVNGRMVPLKSKLENGDIVEITTAPGQHPSRDWLSVVKTARARNKIKHWINLAERQQAIEIGRKLVEKEARRFNVALKDVTEADYLRVASDYGCATTEDLLAGVGYGKFGPRQVLGKLAPPLPEDPEASPSLASTVKRALGIERDLAIQVHGHNDLMVYRAKCCNPVRGEEIVGYVTRGKGIAVHSKTCRNVQNLLYDADRRIEVEWSGPKYTLYTVKLALTTEDRRGLLAEVTSVISDVHSNIQNIQAHTGEERATIDVTLDTVDIQHLRRIVSSLRKIDGVYEVKRIAN